MNPGGPGGFGDWAGDAYAWHAMAGYLGLILILIAYVILRGWKLPRHAGRYLTLNLVGSGLVLVSLAYRPNLPSAILEGIWFLVSLLGLVRWLQGRRSRSKS